MSGLNQYTRGPTLHGQVVDTLQKLGSWSAINLYPTHFDLVMKFVTNLYNVAVQNKIWVEGFVPDVSEGKVRFIINKDQPNEYIINWDCYRIKFSHIHLNNNKPKLGLYVRIERNGSDVKTLSVIPVFDLTDTGPMVIEELTE